MKAWRILKKETLEGEARSIDSDLDSRGWQAQELGHVGIRHMDLYFISLVGRAFARHR